MKVSFVNLKPLSNRGGAEKWISEVGHIIEDMGNEVEILVPSCENNIAEIAGFKHIFYKSRIFILMKRLKLLNFYPPLLNIPLDNNLGVVYVTTIHSLLLFKKVIKLNTKLIVGTHDLFIPNHSVGVDLFQKISLSGINKLSKRHAITVHSLNLLTTNMFRKSKTDVIEIGNEFIVLLSEKKLEKNQEKLDSDRSNKFRVFFLGNLEPRKGSKLIPKLFRSFSANDKIEFVIAGKIKDKKLLKKLSTFHNNFIFKGEIDDLEKEFLFSNSDLFMFLSEREASPIVIEEAFSNGLPVVSTWVSIVKLNSFKISECTVCNRKIREVKNSIIKYYEYWSRDTQKYYSEKKARSVLYYSTYEMANYKEQLVDMILSS